MGISGSQVPSLTASEEHSWPLFSDVGPVRIICSDVKSHRTLLSEQNCKGGFRRGTVCVLGKRLES